MLSRSNSNAGDRLRRAKSTSSAHTTSSGHQRSSTSIDPFVVRQHAETAALEAYHRAKQLEDPIDPQAYRPVPPKLHRRRSQATGKTEGSHFEDARLGRRRSASKKDESRGPQATRPQYVPSEALTSETGEGEVVVTRKRSIIPPSSVAKYSVNEPSTLTSSSRRDRRKSQTAYTDGSPIPRNAVVARPSSTFELPTSHSQNAHRHGEYFAALSKHESAVQPTKRSIRETQTDDEILALAQCPDSQGEHSRKLKERKSFILAPFQLRRATNVRKEHEQGYDTVLPPFNYADEGSLLPPPPPPPPIYTAPAFSVSNDKKSRTFSDSLKGRFKKVFRKAMRVPTVPPAQHVQATHLHVPVATPLSTPTITVEEREDPFTVNSGHHDSHFAVPDVQSSVESRHSSGEQSATKSRVTSWTNSTVAGTWSTRDDVEAQDTADEHGRLKRSDSTSTLKKARSFFGRPVINKLRRASRANLQGSEESNGLYSALQERIQPADSASQAAVSENESQSVRVGSALDTLPSRQGAESTVSSRGGGGWQSATIRSVTPDPTSHRLEIPSPVAEVVSPDNARPRSRQDGSHDGSTPTSRLQRRPAMKAPTPSKEQIERRIERCKNRWQSPLDELSPTAPRPTRHALEDNPYEMRSLSRTLHQPVTNDLPHHARVVEQLTSGRPDVLSPSVYSRGTDGESPRPDTPAAQGGMVVTITGREVKSYAISPSKVEHPVKRAIHASQEWRRWLSDEMNGWDGSSALQDLSIPKDVLKDTAPTNVGELPEHKSSRQQADATTDQCPSSASTTLEPPRTQIKSKACAPRPSSRLSSYMNDRYPMIDTGRNSSDQSIGRRSRISSHADSRPSPAELNARPPAAQDRKASAEGKSLKSALARQRVITKPRSMAQIAFCTQDADHQASAKVQAVNAVTETKDIANPQPRLSSPAMETKPPPAKRPRSAFDLRANYKSRPLEVRRSKHPLTNTNSEIGDQTPSPNMMEDSTILNISAGPYACAAITGDENKENVHPASEPADLPALSSSEWLAAGTSKKREREVQSLSKVHPALRDRRSTSRYSSTRSQTGTPTEALSGSGGVGGSPGHRLASSWLEGKREKEASPAFV